MNLSDKERINRLQEQKLRLEKYIIDRKKKIEKLNTQIQRIKKLNK